MACRVRASPSRRRTRRSWSDHARAKRSAASVRMLRRRTAASADARRDSPVATAERAPRSPPSSSVWAIATVLSSRSDRSPPKFSPEPRSTGFGRRPASRIRSRDALARRSAARRRSWYWDASVSARSKVSGPDTTGTPSRVPSSAWTGAATTTMADAKQQRARLHSESTEGSPWARGMADAPSRRAGDAQRARKISSAGWRGFAPRGPKDPRGCRSRAGPPSR
jgi:hypothetical protein